jgi:hypothetical protein
MTNNNNTPIISLTLLALISVLGCSKPAVISQNPTIDTLLTTRPYNLSYGDSILYLKPSGSNTVLPTEQRAGVYSAFPDGIEINQTSGAINLDSSETGLRYRISHTATNGTVTTTTVVISGITFIDKYYRLSQNDSIAFPVYNANVVRALPVNGSSFDDGNSANSGGCSVRTTDGKINLAQCVRNGIFGTNPKNDERKDFDIYYRLNDNSGKSLNKIRVRLYYYKTMADVTPDLIQTLQDRQSEGVFLQANDNNPGGTILTARTEKTAKPRPPCVVIVAQ